MSCTQELVNLSDTCKKLNCPSIPKLGCCQSLLFILCTLKGYSIIVYIERKFKQQISMLIRVNAEMNRVIAWLGLR